MIILLLTFQLTTISKLLSIDKTPSLKSLTVLPLLLTPDRDEELLRLTENRVPVFSHELVPDYLRTKPEPEVEHKMVQLELKASNLSYEASQVIFFTINPFTIMDMFFLETSRSVQQSGIAYL